MTHWFTVGWWKYLLAAPSSGGTSDSLVSKIDDWFVAVVCRAKGHPYGVIYYNPGGLEPDMTCKNCGDDLG